MNKKISIVIPLLNKGPYILKAIQSVLNQTIKNFEIIVIDGGSSDGGPDIVKRFKDPRIHILEQTGKGVSSARNEAVSFAENDFIAFLDADDEWMPYHLETIFRLIENYPEAGLFSTAYKIQTPDGRTRWPYYQCIPNSPWEGLLPNYFKSIALGDHPVWTSVVVIPKKIFQDAGGFPEGYWWGEDDDLFGKIALKYPVAFSRELGGIYHWDTLNRVSERITSVDYEDEPFVKTARIAFMKNEVPPEFREPINEYLAFRKIFRAIQYVRAGHPDTAQKILRQCDTKWHNNAKMKWLIVASIPRPIYLFFRDIRRKLIKNVKKEHPVPL